MNHKSMSSVLLVCVYSCSHHRRLIERDCLCCAVRLLLRCCCCVQVWVGVIGSGPTGVPLNSSYANRNSDRCVIKYTIVCFAAKGVLHRAVTCVRRG
jgi:hypothetical protein